jgi:NTP pyrophosphatase (non-canonical NTP hydrolase)
MTYYIYHIPGKKIGVTRNLQERVTNQQGYEEGEYDILMKSDNISYISEQELVLQKAFGYKVDRQSYEDLKPNKNNEMKINITEQTTTFPCPVNKLKGQLMDNVGLRWMTEHGEFMITNNTIDWILSNVKESMYDSKRCYVYNKAFARYYDNNDAYSSNSTLADAHMREEYAKDQYNGNCKAGALSPAGIQERCHDCDCDKPSQFDLIREWANERGLYEHGDPKTQSLKLVEEVGEICRATLKEDHDEVIDGIGDCVVVLTNLAELHGVSIEECIASAYGVISKRTGKMVNGTFKKD